MLLAQQSKSREERLTRVNKIMALPACLKSARKAEALSREANLNVAKK